MRMVISLSLSNLHSFPHNYLTVSSGKSNKTNSSETKILTYTSPVMKKYRPSHFAYTEKQQNPKSEIFYKSTAGIYLIHLSRLTNSLILYMKNISMFFFYTYFLLLILLFPISIHLYPKMYNKPHSIFSLIVEPSYTTPPRLQ